MCVNLGCDDTKKLAAHKLLPLVVGLVQTHLHHLAVGIAELVKKPPFEPDLSIHIVVDANLLELVVMSRKKC